MMTHLNAILFSLISEGMKEWSEGVTSRERDLVLVVV